MTREDLINKLIDYAEDDFDPQNSKQASFVEDCVDSAISETLNHMCPWQMTAEDVERYTEVALSRYPWIINRVAQFHFDKQGKEGVTTYYEAGQTQSYGTGGTPDSMFIEIVPIAKIV